MQWPHSRDRDLSGTDIFKKQMANLYKQKRDEDLRKLDQGEDRVKEDLK